MGRDQLPRIDANAHKGTRKKLAIVGGAHGMAGAAILAAEGALRSGIGMVKLVVAEASLPSIQEREPYSLATSWPADDTGVERDIVKWADAVVIGPGLGRDDASRALLERVLRTLERSDASRCRCHHPVRECGRPTSPSFLLADRR